MPLVHPTENRLLWLQKAPQLTVFEPLNMDSSIAQRLWFNVFVQLSFDFSWEQVHNSLSADDIPQRWCPNTPLMPP